MKEALGLRGIVTVLNTPFTEAGGIDLPGLRANVKRAVGAGVAGFLVPALAGEAGKLSEVERRLIVENVIDASGGRAPVIGGASAPEGAQRIRLARDLIALGCDGVLASIPFESEAQYEAAVRELAALTPGFLMLQDWDPSGPGLPVELIARLFAEVGAFRALKIEVVPAGPKYTRLRELTGGRLHLSGGWAVMQMIDALDRGVDAFMPTGMHFIYAQIYALYAGGRRDAAQALFERALPILAFSNQHLDISIHFFKRLLHAQGIYATARVREPILPFDRFHERAAEEMIRRAIALENEIIDGAI